MTCISYTKLARRSSKIIKSVKDRHENILSKLRWKVYFRDLPNDILVKDTHTIGGGVDPEVSLGQISREELLDTIKKVKKGKETGSDKLPPDAMQQQTG